MTLVNSTTAHRAFRHLWACSGLKACAVWQSSRDILTVLTPGGKKNTLWTFCCVHIALGFVADRKGS